MHPRLTPRVARAALALVLLASTLGAPAVDAASSASVTLQGFAFHPQSVTVTLPATGAAVVSWQNDDGASHDVTSDDGAFAVLALAPGADGTREFAAAGTYAYHCSIHPSMTGTVVVEAAPPANRAPVAAFSVASDGLAVSVDASASTDPDGDALTFAWDWGDGSPEGEGATATHVYAAAGTYVVRLTASDGSLSAEASRDVVVAEAAANRRPTLALADGPASGAVVRHGIVEWSGTATDPDGDAVTVAARIAGGGSVPVEGGASWTARLNATALEGEVVVEVVASDGELDSAPLRLSVRVVPNRPPVALPAADLSGFVDDVVMLRGVWSDPDGDLALVQVSVDGAPFVQAFTFPNGTWMHGFDGTGRTPGPVPFRVRALDADATGPESEGRALVVARAGGVAPPGEAATPGAGALAAAAAVGLAAALARRRRTL